MSPRKNSENWEAGGRILAPALLTAGTATQHGTTFFRSGLCGMGVLTQRSERLGFGQGALCRAGESEQQAALGPNGEPTAFPSLRVAGPRLHPALSRRDMGPELQRELHLRQRGGLQPHRRRLRLRPRLAGSHLRAALPGECPGLERYLWAQHPDTLPLELFCPQRRAQMETVDQVLALLLTSLGPLSHFGSQPSHL